MDNPAPTRVSTEDVPEDRAVFERMIRGGMYHASDPYVQKIARQEGTKVRAINAEEDDEKRMELLRQFMGIGKEIEFIWTGPFFAEYVSVRSRSAVLVVLPRCADDSRNRAST